MKTSTPRNMMMKMQFIWDIWREPNSFWYYAKNGKQEQKIL